MSVNSVKVGDRVQIKDKDCYGTVAFTGHPSFAAGKWIGVILDEPKGKNNGTVKGQAYFKCAENHGMFVRPIQLKLLDDAGNVMDPTSPPSAINDDSGAARARSRLNNTSSRRRNEPTASRLSLAGSRSQLSSPSVENLNVSHIPQLERRESSIGIESGIPLPTTIKRASFVEKSPSTSSSPVKKQKAQDDRNNTGFVETLKPHFVPGQAMAGSMSSGIGSNNEEKLSHFQLLSENENLKSQVTDLNEKLETLRVKRMQDKEKLKEYEKTKLQLDQLLEFKSKVMESQGSLQRELQRARQEARDAQQEKGNYQDEMADLAETVEMATLDKEMAEEKAETLQIELDQLKEKLEEKSLDLEILRTEMSERMGGNISTNTTTSYEFKQLEQQNIRLRDTLVKMRDLSAHEKHEFQKLQKDLDQKKSEILELGRTKEKLSARVEEMEHQIADLQEQVDAALGAEEMVEMLGEKKMTLEERVLELEEAVSDLEALQDMSDQLAESSKELELELREELDLALGSVRDAQRHKEAALETLADRETTITKFRELTSQLQEQCLQLQNRVQSSESMQSGGSADQQLAEILDFQKTFAETRAQTKAVDLELRRLETEEARNHVKYLLSFMPPTFMIRGGDNDAILTLLLIPRMTQKTDILISQVRDKYQTIEKIDRSSLLKGHTVDQYTFKSRICGHMYALQTVLGCFESCLNTCSPDNLLKVGAVYPEMLAQEKSLDFFIQLAKKDQLDENVPLEGIEKCSSYFSTMFSVLFGECSVSMSNQAKMVMNGTRTLSCICDAITTEAIGIKCLIDGDYGDIGLLLQHIETNCEVIQQHLNSARRRVPRDQLLSSNIINLGLDNNWSEQFSACYQNSIKITKTLQDLLKSALQTITISGDFDTGIDSSKLKEMAAISTEKIYDTDDLGPVSTIKSSLITLQQLAANLAQKMAECENELAITGQNILPQKTDDNNLISPINIRSQIVKKESEETKILARKLETRDIDVREVKIALREKQEELSEMSLRKELAEKKLATQQHENEMNIEKLKRKLEEAQNQLKRKEKEFEETMDHLQTDIDSLESERGQLKEKLKSYGKKTTPIPGIPSSVNDGINIPTTPGDNTTTSSASINVTSSGQSSHDNRLLVQEISALKEALNNENRLKQKLLSESLKNKLDALDPIPIIAPVKQVDDKIQLLQQKRNKLIKEIHNTIVFPKIPDLTKNNKHSDEIEPPVIEKISPAYEIIKRQLLIKELGKKVEDLNNEICQVKITRTMGGQAPTNFGIFPCPEMASAMREKKQIIAAQINIPYNGPNCVQSVNVGTNELRQLHSLLTY
ncbi:dynactin subunit 1 isoform X2 [Aphidius gifuensis]|uniref:dynactin subunit 1 isoform X2 n=1 Tax=Aphidius gifuensis TaxID=684658 RepID=UPI001CDBD651|nr:dynactin subunit 1 isoform X2 [Aphidius gifuensis]